jgi:hypothetical protein
MSKNDELENDIINNSWTNYLYNHEFEDGRFFQTVHEEEADQNGVTFKLASKTLLKVVFLKDKADIEGFEIIKITHGTEKQRIKLSKFNIAQIKVFLSFLCQFDLSAIAEKKLKLHEENDYSKDDVLTKFRDLIGAALSASCFEQYLNDGLFIAKDLVNTGYRKLQLSRFLSLLEESGFWKQYCEEVKIRNDSEEKAWQHFFHVNPWIFGYGLDYRFNSILQREAYISETELNGSNTVISDYLLGDKFFTTFVEIKKPSTPIFGIDKNRSNSWRLSNDLIWSVSQILEQKAAGLIKFETQQYVTGEPISQKSYDSKVILVIGHWNELLSSANTFEKEIKKKTFELFRRDSRNVEILTFDELYERAKFIVDGSAIQLKIDDQIDDDDLPF